MEDADVNLEALSDSDLQSRMLKTAFCLIALLGRTLLLAAGAMLTARVLVLGGFSETVWYRERVLDLMHDTKDQVHLRIIDLHRYQREWDRRRQG